MEKIDYISLYFLTLISLYFMFNGYSIISKNKYKFNFRNIVLLLISTLFFVINTSVNFMISKTLISFFIFITFCKFIFKNDIRTTVSSSLICFLLMLFNDFIMSVFIILIPKLSYVQFDCSDIAKGLFTLIVSFSTYLCCKIKIFKKVNNMVIELSKNNYVYLLLIFLTVTFVISIATKFSLDYNYQQYFLDVTVLGLFLFLLLFALLKNYKANKESNEKETLLSFISEYEKIIDKNRINKHEMLNNLIILKSFKNKNTKEYNKVLDDLIVMYDNNSEAAVKNISKLPTGLKGILYYKINDMKKKNINLNINISKRVSSPLEKLDADEYVILSKVLGIVMDNALEAALKTNDKIVFIDVFEQNGQVIIILENSYNNDINMEALRKKNFSTKGKNRGLGLYIANMLLKKSKHITMNQYVNGMFTTKIIIE